MSAEQAISILRAISAVEKIKFTVRTDYQKLYVNCDDQLDKLGGCRLKRLCDELEAAIRPVRERWLVELKDEAKSLI